MEKRNFEVKHFVGDTLCTDVFKLYESCVLSQLSSMINVDSNIINIRQLEE